MYMHNEATMPMPIPTILGPKSGGLSIGMVLVKKGLEKWQLTLQIRNGIGQAIPILLGPYLLLEKFVK